MAETQAWAKCEHCGGDAAVKKNRSGRAYYRCDHCGVKVEHTWQRTSDKLMQVLGVIERPAPTPEPEPEPAPAPVRKRHATLIGGGE